MNRSISFRTQIAMNGMTLVLVTLLLLIANTFANSGTAAITTSSATTTTVSYQGHLTNLDGTPVGATLPMTFKLYSAPTGGTAVWTEQRSGTNAVPINDGLFNVALGSVTPIPVSLFSAPLWLGISINSDAEMSPRERLDGGYAAVAGTVPDNSITSSKLDLNYGSTCLANDIELDATGHPVIPNLNLNFSLDQPALVLISMEGVTGVTPAATANSPYIMSLVLNNEREAVVTGWAGTWFDLDTQRLLRLNAGTYTVSALVTGPGTMKFGGTVYRDRLCLNYVVLGNQ